MKYVTWFLNWNNPDYGTGPESLAAQHQWRIESGPCIDGNSEHSAQILGYASDALDIGIFSDWDMAEVTSPEEALALVKAVEPSAFLTDSGRIGFPLLRSPAPTA